MANQFGQLMSLLNLANQAQYLAAKTAIETYRIKKETGVAISAEQVKAQIAAMDLTAKQKEFLLQQLASERRDTTIRDIAIWAVVGLGTLIILLTIGLSFVKKKQDEKYEYVIEEVKK